MAEKPLCKKCGNYHWRFKRCEAVMETIPVVEEPEPEVPQASPVQPIFRSFQPEASESEWRVRPGTEVIERKVG